MKINKILAAGIAATLAVTSLSAVASAEVKSYTWKMDYTQSKVQWNNQKIAYLDDNDYIKAKDGSYVAASLFISDKLGKADGSVAGSFVKLITTAGTIDLSAAPTFAGATGLATWKLDGTLGGFLATNDTKDLAVGTAGNGAVTLQAADSTKVPTDLVTKEKKLLADLKVAKTLAVAAAASAGIVQDGTNPDLEKKGKDMMSSMSQTIQAYKDVLADVENEIANMPAATTGFVANDVADAKLALGALKTWLTTQIPLLQKAYDNAVATVEGEPLLEDDEIGGIVLSKVPVKATKYTAFRDYWKEVPGGFADDMYIQLDSAKVEIVGTKRGSTASETVTKDFAKGYTDFDANHYGKTEDKNHIFVTFAPKYVNRDGFINLNVFGTITDVRITASFKIVKLKDGKTVANNDHLNVDNFEDYYLFQEADYKLYEGVTIKSLAENFKGLVTYFEATSDPDAFNPSTAAANLVAYDNLKYKDRNLFKMYKGLRNSAPTGNAHDNSDSKKTLKPFLKMTTDAEGQTIVRNKVNVLSYTDDFESQTIQDKRDGKTQTYDDAGMGTQPKWFAGLASQAADFFNKQNNGQMIFKFADPANPSLWVSYGIPSTEVGLRTLQGTAMALFFNYKTSTGSISSIGVVDKDAWTITFDMATVLDDFGGLTKATLEDIYYGLNTGMQYGDPYNGKGYVVETVTFQYDDAPAAVDATTDDDAAVVVADDDDDDDDVFADDDVIADDDDDDDDDDDAGVIEDDDDDDTDVNNDVDYVDGDDDANPGTGVGLAVIPAIVAAAAAIVSKKRK